jgi:hypothetical protein
VGVGFFVVGEGVGFLGAAIVFLGVGVGVGFLTVVFLGVGVGVGFFVLAASELCATPLVARAPKRIRKILREKLLIFMAELSLLDQNHHELTFRL